MLISSGVSNTCLFAPAPYYKLNKGFFLGFLFKPLGGLRPPRGLNKKALEKYPLFITYITVSSYMQNYSRAPLTYPYCECHCDAKYKDKNYIISMSFFMRTIRCTTMFK